MYFFSAPNKLSLAEKLCIPKGERRDFEDFDLIMRNAQDFAQRHSLELPKNLSEVKQMYREYNSFYRRVYPNTDEMGTYANLPVEEQAKILATRGYPESHYSFLPEGNGKFFWDRVFVSPTFESTSDYQGWGGTLVKVQRPFSLNPLTKAHVNAEFHPMSNSDFFGKLGKGQVLYTNNPDRSTARDFLISTKHLIPKEIIHE